MDPSQFSVERRIGFKGNDAEPDDNSIPRVVNVVTTVYYLPLDRDERSKKRKFHIPLQSLSMHFPVSQYKPSAFSSVIMRIKDGQSLFTGLFFSSGKSVFVKCNSPQHSVYVSQQVRMAMNGIPIIVKHPDSGELVPSTLGQQINYESWNVQNFVLTANLGFNVDLVAMTTFAPDKVKYNPGDFPGAEVEIPVRPASECKCTKVSKCGCKVTILVFDKGSVIVAGPKRVEEGNSAYQRFKKFAELFVDDGAEVQKSDRYQTRIKRLAECLAASKDEEDEEVCDDDDDIKLSPKEEDEALEVAINDALRILSLTRYTDPPYIKKK